MKRCLAVAVPLLIGALAAGFGAAAQNPPTAPADPRAGVPESYKGPVTAIAAIVNDKVITTYDVQQRLRLLILSSGAQIPSQAIPQFQQRALRELVEEQLKLTQAERFELTIDDAEVNDEVRAIAEETGLSQADFETELKRDGIDINGLKSQIRTRIAWSRIVQGRFRTRVKVNDNEIDEAIDRLRAEATNEQFLVSEICLPVPDASQAQQYYQGGLQLIEQMRRGVPFAVVAQQFSGCPTAAGGGDLGWIRAGELPKELDEALRALPPGSVTNPIPSDNSFVIMAVRDKRAPAAPGERTYTLAYAGAPLAEGRNQALLELEKLKTADACSTGQAQRQDLGPKVGVALLEAVRTSELDPRFSNLLEGLDRGDVSAPIEADGALHAVYVCEIDEGLGLPSRSAMEDRLLSRQLARIATQYLRDVERTTHVDIRMKPTQPGQGS